MAIRSNIVGVKSTESYLAPIASVALREIPTAWTTELWFGLLWRFELLPTYDSATWLQHGLRLGFGINSSSDVGWNAQSNPTGSDTSDLSLNHFLGISSLQLLTGLLYQSAAGNNYLKLRGGFRYATNSFNEALSSNTIYVPLEEDIQSALIVRVQKQSGSYWNLGMIYPNSETGIDTNLTMLEIAEQFENANLSWSSLVSSMSSLGYTSAAGTTVYTVDTATNGDFDHLCFSCHTRDFKCELGAVFGKGF